MRIAFVVLLLVIPTLLFSQRRIGPVNLDSLIYYVGGGYSKSAFLELGVASSHRGIGNKSKLIICANYEFHFQRPLLVSMKSKAWLSNLLGPVGGGANLIFNGLFAKDWNLAFAPEIGIGSERVRGFYNYNLFIFHTSYNRIARNVVGLNLWLGRRKA